MKRIVITLSCFLLLVSCKKEDITIQKNDSTTWEIDKSIVDDDIRTRLGYDPNTRFAYLNQESVDVSMLSLANVPLTGESVCTVVAKITNSLAEDVQFSLTYDNTLFDKVKEKYQGFELGEATLVAVNEATKTLSKGAVELTFTLKIPNKR